MTTPRYLFRDFSLDPAARELRRAGELVSLPTSALDCLAYLVANRDRAVGRDELIAAVWGRADVADALLAQTVLRIRRTLGDVGAEDSAIRTIARFGYRWVEVTQADDAPAPPMARPPVETVSDAAPFEVGTGPRPATPSRLRHLAGPIAALLVLGLAAFAAFQWAGRAPRDEAATARMQPAEGVPDR